MFLFPGAFTSCENCGEVMPNHQADEHVCDRERWLDFQLCRLRPEIRSFEMAFAVYMQTSFGKFDAFYAERDRLRRQILSGAAA